MNGRRGHHRIGLVIGAAFMLFMLASNIVAAIWWERTMPGRVYRCTDSIPGDYFTPGSWVHGDWIYIDDLQEAQKVPADSVLASWPLARLWRAWWTAFATTVAVSAALTALVVVIPGGHPRHP